MEPDPSCSPHRQGIRDIRFFLPLFLLPACSHLIGPDDSSVQVTDHTGDPVVWAWVWFLSPETWEEPSKFPSRKDGTVEIDLPPGSYWVAANGLLDTTFQTGSPQVNLDPLTHRFTYNSPIIGDLNGDGQVTKEDVMQLYVRLTRKRYVDSSASDLDGNGLEDWNDLRRLGLYASGNTEDQRIGVGRNDFNIDIVWTSDLTDHQKEIILRAAGRWEEIIWQDVPDRDYSQTPFRSSPSDEWINEFSTQSRFQFNGIVDDVVVFVGRLSATEEARLLGKGGPLRLRYYSLMPSLAAVNLNRDVLADDELLYQVALHELGHALGIGAVWRHKNMLSSDHEYYQAHLACKAYELAGGEGSWIPVEGAAHWKESVFGDEVMSTLSFDDDQDPVSAITVQSLADIGYGVDVRKADPYQVPMSHAAKPLAIGSRRCKVMRPTYGTDTE